MQTTILAATTTWAEAILTAETSWTLKNNGPQVLYVRLDDGTPDPAEIGMKLNSGQSIEGNPNLVGDVWIRTLTETSIVAITK